MHQAPKIAIYAHTNTFGGVETLAIRLSNYLRSSKIPFLLITNKSSRTARELNWAQQIELSDTHTHANDITHVFLPNICGLINPIGLDGFRGARFASMALHPTEMYGALFPCVQRLLEIAGFASAAWVKRILHTHNKYVVQMLRATIDKKSLAAMDGATSRGLRFFYPELEHTAIDVIPLPSVVDWIDSVSKLTHQGPLSIGYLGRMDAFKLSAIDSFIKETLARHNSKTSLHFVGDGDRVADMAHTCLKSGVELINHGPVFGLAAKKLLINNTHLVAAMGTAALDMAGVGHPVIIIDPAHRRNAPPQRLFRFVHEIDDYTLGEYRDSPGYVPGLHTFNEVVRTIQLDDKLGMRQVGYVSSKHAPDIVLGRLVQHILGSELLVDDLLGLSSKVARSFHFLDKSIRGSARAFIPRGWSRG